MFDNLSVYFSLNSSSVLLVSGMIGLNMSPILPYFLSVVLNISSRAMQLVLTEYFVDQEKYFYLILMHANIAFTIGGIVLAATGFMFLTCIEYGCGMFKLAR